MVPDSNCNFAFDAASNCSSVHFNLIMFIAYNHSVYQSLAKNETNYINPAFGGRANLVVLAIDVIQSSKWRETCVGAPGPQKSSEHDARMETVVMEALFAYEESRKVPSNFSCEDENLFTQSGSETISAKEEVAESIVTKVDNAHPSINGQHKVRRKSWDTEDEFLGQCESEDSRDKEKPRKSKEPELISTENPLSIKGSPESKETLGQASSVKSDMGCISQKLAPLEITDKCQDTKDIANNYVEEPPVNDSSITKLDKVLESQRKSSHCDKDFDKSSQAYSSRRKHGRRRKNPVLQAAIYVSNTPKTPSKPPPEPGIQRFPPQ
ncbi:hypothetical protein QYF61_027680 [Mycteria americana]|uniref:Uncharacterized protein n=1 Tax=Mycteria americana TaxID=33587 RepID=A0AAN7MIQ2_MYCAM|nr:hypothetical protein QYF61_027680 [Mycteria americana]